MTPKKITYSKHVHPWVLAISTGALAVFIARINVENDQSAFQARMLPAHERGHIAWQTITPEEVHEGIIVPPHTHVIFRLPDTMKRMRAEILFGGKSADVRFWGYCFPNNTEDASVSAHSGLPGRVFLSEAEQDVMREQQREQQRSAFSVFKHLTEADLNQTKKIEGAIRNEKRFFYGGDTCYIMAQDTIPIGTDEDEDQANTYLETQYGVDPTDSDSDNDGVKDGLELFSLKTDPHQRDTDGDGLLDGIEDVNQNGIVDHGESSPLEWDSDSDGLCDGFCIRREGVRTGFPAPVDYEPDVREIVFGEDLNLDGKMDDGETSPNMVDTDGDGVTDDIEYYRCTIQLDDYLLDDIFGEDANVFDGCDN